MIRTEHKHWAASAVAVLVSLGILSACGGSGESTPTAGATTTLSGIAAVGAPLVASTVEFQCAAGKPASTTTAADGAWSASATGITLPCAIEVSGGTAGGVANTARLHSVATAAGLNNVTTLTTLLTSLMAGQDPAAWFAQLKTSPAVLGNITAAVRTGALSQLVELLKTLPTPVDLPADFDPVTTKFEAKLGDKFDALLEKLATNNIALAQLIAQATEKTPKQLALVSLSGFGGDIVGGVLVDTHEIPAFDPASKRLFVVNGSGVGSVEVWDIADPKAPKQVGTLLSSSYGVGLGGFNSVAVHNGVVALAIQAEPKTGNGTVAFVKASDLSTLSTVTVGALPDMVTFSPDGRYALTANEGEPNSYGLVDSIDPEGSISIIDVKNISAPTVKTASFTAFNGQEDALRTAGVRIFGPGASVAMDLEPEYVTVSGDSKTAYVTLQENNAYAVVDIASAKVTAIRPFGFKDHSIAGYGMDASDEDGGTNTNSGSAKVNIVNIPVKGMYMPDGAANYSINGVTYLVTANEGDVRADWPGFTEETRMRAHCSAGGMDLSVFGASAANFLFDSNLGRLTISNTPNGGKTGKNGALQCNELYSFGGRSFTIWNAATGARVYDSGDAFETITSQQAGKPGFDYAFNASNSNNTLDNRSEDKGPEPESVVVHRFGTKVFAFIGLERVGGVMVYDVTDPSAAKHVTYINTRTGATGDLGPEGLIVIPAAKSPNGVPLLVVANEVSGTTRIFEIKLTY